MSMPNWKTLLHRQWSEWRSTVLFVLFVLVPLKSSFADWNWVPTGSMNPTILEGDMVYVNKLAYDLRLPLTLHRLGSWADPERGDIVVLFSPADDTRLVKRVIGIPGDAIEMRNNRLFINGKPLRYSELSASELDRLPEDLRERSVFAMEDLEGRRHAVMGRPERKTPFRDIPPIVVPPGQYFVMGDNRDESGDSRLFGFADRRLIIGEATTVLVSFNILDWYQPRLERFFSRLN